MIHNVSFLQLKDVSGLVLINAALASDHQSTQYITKCVVLLMQVCYHYWVYITLIANVGVLTIFDDYTHMAIVYGYEGVALVLY